MAVMAGNTASGKVGTEPEQKLRAHLLIVKQEAERMNGAGNGMVL